MNGSKPEGMKRDPEGVRLRSVGRLLSSTSSSLMVCCWWWAWGWRPRLVVAIDVGGLKLLAVRGGPRPFRRPIIDAAECCWPMSSKSSLCPVAPVAENIEEEKAHYNKTVTFLLCLFQSTDQSMITKKRPII